MRSSRPFHQPTLLLIFVLACTPLVKLQAQAIQRSMEQLTKESDAVVVGKVAGLSSEWNADKTRIQTRVTISVDQNVKGDASVKSMTIIVPGGEVDGVGEVYSHAPKFLRDEAVVVFAKKNLAGEYHVSNGNQGKYTILKDEVSSRLSVAGGKSLEEFTTTIKTAIQTQIMK